MDAIEIAVRLEQAANDIREAQRYQGRGEPYATLMDAAAQELRRLDGELDSLYSEGAYRE